MQTLFCTNTENQDLSKAGRNDVELVFNICKGEVFVK